MEKLMRLILGAVILAMGLFGVYYLAVLMLCGIILLGGQIPL